MTPRTSICVRSASDRSDSGIMPNEIARRTRFHALMVHARRDGRLDQHRAACTGA